MQTAEYVRGGGDGDYSVGGTRVSLRSLIADWKRGRAPEQIVADFPSVPLVAVYGAITYYLEHQRELDAEFQAADAAFARARAEAQTTDSAFLAEMRARVAALRPRIERELHAQGIVPDDTPRQSDE